MNVNGWLVCTTLGLFTTSNCFGQTPPPNDNFSNRIVLTGTDLTLSGTLAGATLEDSREADTYNLTFGSTPATQSVWWSWTAPTNTVLTLQILTSSLDPSQDQFKAGLAVYQATNGSTSPSGLELPAWGIRFINFRFAPQTLSIPVTTGTEYQIQLVGNSSASYMSRLIATNTPVIAEQPRSRSVSSNASALFYVMAAGVSQSWFTFQWRFNGINLPGEIGPELALTNVDISKAGAYSAVVSNSAGFTVSLPATLAVSQSNVPIALEVLGSQSNSLSVSLSGENGRTYRIESSTDLTNWAPDTEFRRNPVLPNSTSIVFNTNSPLALMVTNNSAREFYRSSLYAPSPSEVDLCLNHLQQIRIAKLLWQRDYELSPIATPTPGDLIPYYPRHVAPFCPRDLDQSFDTSYLINNLQAEPLCEIFPVTHALEEPR